MPRRKQYQTPQAPNAQAYGMRGDQIQAQQAMPLPNLNPSTGGMGPGGAPAPDLTQMAAAFDPGITPLTAPTERSNEPVTAGLSRGMGPGPEVLRAPSMRQRVADTLAGMAAESGDDTLLDLSLRVRGGW